MAAKRDGAWRNWSWKDYQDDVYLAAQSLIRIGLKPRQVVNIIGFNSPEWHIADLAAIAAGGIAAGIYTTSLPEACFYIADHSEATVVFVENEIHAKKFLALEDKLPNVLAYIQWSGTPPAGKKWMSWIEFMEYGKPVERREVDARIDATRAGHCATLIYTSGTTGPPKAVMISHDNLTWTAAAMVEFLDFREPQVGIGYLPLSHIAAQLVDIHIPYSNASAIWFAQPDALRGSLGTTLKEVRPTVFLGVPRVWEKIQETMVRIGQNGSGLQKTISGWAKGIGLAAAYAEQRGEPMPWGWTMASFIFNKVKVGLGLDRCKYMATSAAPISLDTLDYFNSLNVPLMEVYGMSECTGPQTVNKPGARKTGSVGRPMDGTELRLMNPDDAGNGEICFSGRHIFMGYMKNDAGTAETIDKDGYLHSGDIGRYDSEGFLNITGRLKELIITAGGENVPPVLLEDEVKHEIGAVISNIQVIGDKRKFLTALVTLRCKPIAAAVEGDYPFSDELVPEIAGLTGSAARTVGEAKNDEAIRKYIDAGIARANGRAASNAQRIGKFTVLERDFSIAGNELTPTLKLKRRIVADKYQAEIEQMYAGAAD